MGIESPIFAPTARWINRCLCCNHSGKFNVRIPPDLHEAISTAAAADGKSLNQWVRDEAQRSMNSSP